MTSQLQPRKTKDKPFSQPLPFYLATPTPSQYLPLPHPQSSLLNPVSPQEYRPENSLSYLQPTRTFEYKQYVLFTEQDRLLKESSMSPGPAPFQPLQLPSGGRFQLGTEVERVQLAKPGPGSYSPSPKLRSTIPCAAGWRASPTPTVTAQSFIDGAASPGPGSFLGLAPLERIGSVSWGTGVGGRFDTKELDQTGPLLGPGSYELEDSRCFGRTGSSVIIRAEHDTAVLLRRMKNAGRGGSNATRDRTSTALSSAAAARQVLVKALNATAAELVTALQNEFERDAQERLSFSCAVVRGSGEGGMTHAQFKRMTQKRRQAKQRILALTKKSTRLKRALGELEKKKSRNLSN